MSEVNYLPVPIEKIRAGCPLPADVYVFINQKYICFRYAGDDISPERLNQFLALHHSALFVSGEEIETFMAWIEGEREKIMNHAAAVIGEENKDIIDIHMKTEENLFQVFADENLDEEKVEALQNQTEQFVEAMKERKGLIESFTSMLSFNDGIAHHSTNVASLAVFLGMSCGHAHPLILENLYFAGLFHDYGKIKIHPTVLESPQSSQYKSAMINHPETSVKYIRSIAEKISIQDSVITIVEQHHEWYNGQGFPKGLKGKEIYELSRIFSIANAFDNRMAKEETKDAKTYARVIKQFSFDKGKEFDPEIVQRCMEAFVFAFSRDKLVKAKKTPDQKTSEIDLATLAEDENDEDLLALADALVAQDSELDQEDETHDDDEELSAEDIDKMLEG